MRRERMKPIILEKHNADCFAVRAVSQGQWLQPWGHLESSFIRRDKLGRRHATANMWALVVTCNDPRCRGSIAFRMDDVTEKLNLVAYMGEVNAQ